MEGLTRKSAGVPFARNEPGLLLQCTCMYAIVAVAVKTNLIVVAETLFTESSCKKSVRN